MKVEEWQHSYHGDSGIQSGANTVREDDGDYGTSKYTTVTTTTVSSEYPEGTRQPSCAGSRVTS